MNTRSKLRSDFWLEEWLVQPDRNRISGPDGHVHLRPRTMEVLLCLAEHAGEVVTRDEFSDEVWHPSVVSDDALTRCISELRGHLGDQAGDYRFIETIPKRGYRLRAVVTPVSLSDTTTSADYEGAQPAVPITKRRAGRGGRRRPGSYRLPLLITLLVLCIGLAFWYFPKPQTSKPAISSLAVLPFQNLSPDPANAYFSGGLHDELLTQLSKIDALSLRGRTSMLAYTDTTKSIREVAEELDVGALLEGSVQVVDGRLRVNVQLIDAVTDEHLWAESYDRNLDDVFAIQSDIVERVVKAVGARLDSSDLQLLDEIPTANPTAYQLYLQGQDYYRRPGRQRHHAEVAQQLYEHALMLDPQFALAYAALAEIHGIMHWLRYDTSPERLEKQRVAAETAFELAPDLPQARQAMGLWHYFGQRDWEAALAQYEATQLGLPNDARIAELIAYTHRRIGNWDQVVAGFKKVAEIDPRNPNVFLDLGANTYAIMRRYEEAIDAYDEALALAPDLHMGAVRRGWTHARWRGELDTLRTAIEPLPEDYDLAALGSAAAQHAELLYWERNADGLLEHLEGINPEIFKGMAFLYPKSLYAAWAHRLRGDQASAIASFEATLTRLDAVHEELPEDWRVRAARGLALAGLELHEDAVEEAHWLALSPIYRDDAYAGPDVALARARILAQAGEAEHALDVIDQLLARPSLLSAHFLMLDPLWDPIREHPRFLALVEDVN